MLLNFEFEEKERLKPLLWEGEIESEWFLLVPCNRYYIKISSFKYLDKRVGKMEADFSLPPEKKTKTGVLEDWKAIISMMKCLFSVAQVLVLLGILAY